MVRPHNNGFTLIELLVVLVIMSLMTLAFLETQSKFDSSTIMRSLAYQVALSVRQAQVYSTSVAQNSPSSGTFGPTFGLSFGGSAQTYFLFSDPADVTQGEYDAGVSTIKTFSLNPSYRFHEACLQGKKIVGGSIVWSCTGKDDSSGGPTASTTDIMFRRPNPDALMMATHAGVPFAGNTYSDAYIQIVSNNNNDTRVIHVNAVGEITVCGLGNITSATGYTINRIKSGTVTCY